MDRTVATVISPCGLYSRVHRDVVFWMVSTFPARVVSGARSGDGEWIGLQFRAICNSGRRVGFRRDFHCVWRELSQGRCNLRLYLFIGNGRHLVCSRHGRAIEKIASPESSMPRRLASPEFLVQSEFGPFPLCSGEFQRFPRMACDGRRTGS